MASSPDRTEQLREAAMRVFARKGYRHTVVEDVAQEAGVSKGTIYTYFDRKEQLLGAVHQGLFDEIRARERKVLESEQAPLEKIRGMLESFVEVVGSRERFARVMIDIWIAGMRDPDQFGIDFAGAYEEYRTTLGELLREAQDRGDVDPDVPEIAPSVLIGAVEGVLLQWLIDPEGVDFPNVAEQILDILYRGIQPRPDS